MVILVLTVSVLFMGYIAISNNVKTTEHIEEHIFPSVMKIEELRLSIINIHSWVTNISIMRSESIKEDNQMASQYYKKANNIIIELKEIYKEEPQKIKMLVDLQIELDNFYITGVEITEAYFESGTFYGNEMLQVFNIVENQLSKTLQDMVKHNEKKLNDNLSQMKNDSNFLKIFIAINALFLIILSIFIATVLTKLLKKQEEKSEKDIRKEKDINQTLFDGNPALIITISKDGQVLTMNNTMLNELDYRKSEVVGNDYFDFFVPNGEMDKLENIIEKIVETQESIVLENHIVSKDGKLKLVEWHISPYLNDLNEFEYLFGIGIDITARRKAENQLIQSQKMDTVGTLAGGIAHDFNNVLAGILGTLSLMKFKLKKNGNIPTEKLNEFIDNIEESGNRAADVVKQLLTLSRQDDYEFENVDLNYVIGHVMKIAENSFDKLVKLEQTYFEQPAEIHGDATQLEQAILNLCINGSHSMTIMKKENEEHGGTLSVLVEKVKLDSYSFPKFEFKNNFDYYLVSIRDTGVGMSEETIRKIFNPFFTTKDKGVGTGLGLYMIYNIINQHDGFIDVYSEEGKGTVFNVYLPVLREISTKKKESDLSEDSFVGDGLILIVDDEKRIREIAGEIFTECGYDVIYARDGIEGIELFRKRHNEIKLILLDMAMPKMSGRDAYLEMKKIDPSLKVLLSSGFRKDERVQEIIDLGVNGFLNKPFSFKSLMKGVQDVLNENNI